MKFMRKDNETGEWLTCQNQETGEEESLLSNPPKRRNRKLQLFKIPSSLITPKTRRTRERCPTSPTYATAILYLLPASVLFHPLVVILLLIMEILIHVWAHRKNKTIKHRNWYYQSPLHIICKEFCASCREENAKLKISKFQEKRADKFKKYGLEYVRRIV